MNNQSIKRAFTIIELLVVVSIIALLVGILLPAIGKARDGALLTRSQGNIKQLGTAAVTYSAEWNDRQVTWINDNFSRYGATGLAAAAGYPAQTGSAHPPFLLGKSTQGTWGYWLPGPPFNIGTAANWVVVAPIDFATKFGAFRIPNGYAFSRYINGRFYDPTYYAPKDTAAIASVERYWESADEFMLTEGSTNTTDPFWSSYCFSPAAMLSPDVLSLNKTTNQYYTNPFSPSMPSAFRSPSMSQAQYSDLKTHVLEHHWLQGRKKNCNPGFVPGTYEGCEPYYFNHAYDSNPVTLFYDGHIGPCGVANAMDSHARVKAQLSQAPNPGTDPGLWSVATPMGADGYFIQYGYDSFSRTSFHILTINGIKGRDIVSK